MSKENFKNLRWLWLAIFVVIIDQITKYLAAKYLPWVAQVEVNSFFNFYLTYNNGAAFSLLSHVHFHWFKWFFVVLAAAVSGGIIVWLIRSPRGENLKKIALMLILGGAIGNLIDRVQYGVVRDFLDFHWHTYHWATFNLADSAVSIGAVLLAIIFIFM
jgi:signal peptidase II